MATIITDATELQAMKDNLADDYELGNDIDASATSGWNGGAGFEPVGPAGTPFTGTLDGKGFTISDLFINRPLEDNVGLFGVIHTGATLTDVVLVDVDITGDDYVGGLIGYDYGTSTTISGCHTTGSVTGSDDSVGGLIGGEASTGLSISESYSTATITAGAGGSYIGGFIGNVAGSGTIDKCYATGNVTSGGFRLGGFIGQLYAISMAISKCYAEGDVESTFPVDDVGGFVGYVRETTLVTINDSYARGSATGDERIGGFVGHLLSGTITNCYSTGTPSGNADVGGFCGLNGDTITDCFWDITTSGEAASDGGTGKTTAQMKVIATFAAWNIIQSASDLASGYPYLSWQLGSSHIWYIFGAIPDVPDSPRTTVDVQDITPLEAIRNIEMAARGRFYTDEEGNAVYKSRYGRNP